MNTPLRVLALITAAAPAFFTPALLAAPIPAESTITAATVYPDRAVVTRQAKFTLPAGLSEITIAALPAGLDEASLQVSGRGSATATLLDVSARSTFLTAEADPRVAALEATLATLQREDATLGAKLALNERQRALLQNIEQSVLAPLPVSLAATPPVPARPSLDDAEKLLAFSATQTTRLDADRAALDTQRATLADQLSATERQLKELRGRTPARRQVKTVSIRLAAAQPGNLDLTLAYALPGASWSPAYDARLRTAERKVELSSFGLVRNATGEDWTDIALTLSTARPSLGGGAPVLTPWLLEARPQRTEAPTSLMGEFQRIRANSQDKAVTNNLRQLSAGADQYFLANGAVVPVPAAPEPEAAYAAAAISTGATSATFAITAPATLPSDNSPRRVAIGTKTLNALLQYQASPKLLETAFLSAYVKHTADYPLLAGPVNTFLNDAFIATATLRTVMPGEAFQIALGADEGIAIKRRLANRFSENTGLTDSGRRTTYEVVISLTNNKPTAERIYFREPLPLSRDERVVVKLLAPAERDIGKKDEPGRELTREDDNILAWRLDLKPAEKREITLKFTIEHPADLPVTGLE
jgi:uncharacterized protein (TIGR02231 family)